MMTYPETGLVDGNSIPGRRLSAEPLRVAGKAMLSALVVCMPQPALAIAGNMVTNGKSHFNNRFARAYDPAMRISVPGSLIPFPLYSFHLIDFALLKRCSNVAQTLLKRCAASRASYPFFPATHLHGLAAASGAPLIKSGFPAPLEKPAHPFQAPSPVGVMDTRT
ncbi:hypothetical protein [Cupriavidus sp. PET2-C1]